MSDEPTVWGAFKNGLFGRAETGEKVPLAMKGAFAGYTLNGPTLSKGLSSWPIGGAIVEFEHGANLGGRVTLTRVALTGVFALLLKKDRNKVYVVVETARGDQVLIEGKAKEEKQARRFAHQLQQASERYA